MRREGFGSHIRYTADIMVKLRRNIFRKFFDNPYMFSECLNKMVFIKDITKFAEINYAGTKKNYPSGKVMRKSKTYI